MRRFLAALALFFALGLPAQAATTPVPTTPDLAADRVTEAAAVNVRGASTDFSTMGPILHTLFGGAGTVRPTWAHQNAITDIFAGWYNSYGIRMVYPTTCPDTITNVNSDIARYELDTGLTNTNLGLGIASFESQNEPDNGSTFPQTCHGTAYSSWSNYYTSYFGPTFYPALEGAYQSINVASPTVTNEGNLCSASQFTGCTGISPVAGVYGDFFSTHNYPCGGAYPNKPGGCNNPHFGCTNTSNLYTVAQLANYMFPGLSPGCAGTAGPWHRQSLAFETGEYNYYNDNVRQPTQYLSNVTIAKYLLRFEDTAWIAGESKVFIFQLYAQGSNPGLELYNPTGSGYTDSDGNGPGSGATKQYLALEDFIAAYRALGTQPFSRTLISYALTGGTTCGADGSVCSTLAQGSTGRALLSFHMMTSNETPGTGVPLASPSTTPVVLTVAAAENPNAGAPVLWTQDATTGRLSSTPITFTTDSNGNYVYNATATAGWSAIGWKPADFTGAKPLHVWSSAYYGSGANGGENKDLAAQLVSDEVDWAETQDTYASSFATALNHFYRPVWATQQAYEYLDFGLLHNCTYSLDSSGTSAPDCTNAGSVPVAGNANGAYLHSSAGVRMNTGTSPNIILAGNPGDATMQAAVNSRISTFQTSASSKLTAIFADDVGGDICNTVFGQTNNCTATFGVSQPTEYTPSSLSWTTAVANMANAMTLPMLNNGITPLDAQQSQLWGAGTNHQLGTINEGCFTQNVSPVVPMGTQGNPALTWIVVLHEMLQATALTEPLQCFNYGEQNHNGAATDGVNNEPLRIYAYASWLMGYSQYQIYRFQGGGSDVDGSSNEHTALFPELHIVPDLTTAVQTATYSTAVTNSTALSSLEVLTSPLAVASTDPGGGVGPCLFRREFGNAWQNGVSIGPIAVVVNRCSVGVGSSYTYATAGLTQTYTHSLVLNQWTLGAGGQGTASAAFTGALPTSFAPVTGYILGGGAAPANTDFHLIYTPVPVTVTHA